MGTLSERTKNQHSTTSPISMDKLHQHNISYTSIPYLTLDTTLGVIGSAAACSPSVYEFMKPYQYPSISTPDKVTNQLITTGLTEEVRFRSKRHIIPFSRNQLISSNAYQLNCKRNLYSFFFKTNKSTLGLYLYPFTSSSGEWDDSSETCQEFPC